MDPYSNTQPVVSASGVGSSSIHSNNPNFAQPAIGTFNVPSDTTLPATEYATNPPGKFAFERKMDEAKQQKDLYGDDKAEKEVSEKESSSWFSKDKDTKDTAATSTVGAAAVSDDTVADDDATTTHKKGFGAKLKEGFKHLKQKIAGHHHRKDKGDDHDSPDDEEEVDRDKQLSTTHTSDAAVGSGIGSGLATTHVGASSTRSDNDISNSNSTVDSSHINMDDSIKKLEDKLATSNISVSGAGTNYIGSGLGSGVDTSSIGVSQLGGPAVLASAPVTGMASDTSYLGSGVGGSSFGSSDISHNPVDDKIPSFISSEVTPAADDKIPSFISSDVTPASTFDSSNLGGSSTLPTSQLGSSNLGSSSLARDTYPATSSSYSGLDSGVAGGSYLVSDLDNNFGSSNLGSSQLGSSTLGSGVGSSYSGLGSSNLGSDMYAGSSGSGLGSTSYSDAGVSSFSGASGIGGNSDLPLGYHTTQTNMPASSAANTNFAQPSIGTFNVPSDASMPATEYTTNPPAKFSFERAQDQRKQEQELFGTSPSSGGLASGSYNKGSSWSRPDDSTIAKDPEDKGLLEKIKEKLTG